MLVIIKSDDSIEVIKDIDTIELIEDVEADEIQVSEKLQAVADRKERAQEIVKQREEILAAQKEKKRTRL